MNVPFLAIALKFEEYDSGLEFYTHQQYDLILDTYFFLSLSQYAEFPIFILSNEIRG